MSISTDGKEVELLVIIVNNGLGSKVLRVAKNNGISGGTIVLGKGTVKNRILQLFDIYDIRKEIVLMLAEKQTANNALDVLCQEFHFNKPNHGIAFSISVSKIYGVKSYRFTINEERGVDSAMYKAIFTVVEKGKAEDVIDAANKTGARGGTIINARGSGIHETIKLFSMDIEPEKEIVLILSEEAQTEAIVSSISEALQIEEPGKGIIFVQNVNRTIGLAKEEKR